MDCKNLLEILSSDSTFYFAYVELIYHFFSGRWNQSRYERHFIPSSSTNRRRSVLINDLLRFETMYRCKSILVEEYAHYWGLSSLPKSYVYPTTQLVGSDKTPINLARFDGYPRMMVIHKLSWLSRLIWADSCGRHWISLVEELLVWILEFVLRSPRQSCRPVMVWEIEKCPQMSEIF